MKEKMKHSRARTLVGVFAVLTALLAALLSSPAAASPAADTGDDRALVERDPVARTIESANRAEFTLVPCLQLTDSIVRLYSAYFLREPDQGGFNFWQAEYESGRWSLPKMSTFFSQSEEFVGLYGSLSDAQFIDLIYQNIFGRAADEGGRNHWLTQMQAGMDRGTVMLNFSESPEYVVQSGTAQSPAGDFNWYPDGTQFTCGFNNATYEIKPGLPFLDVVLVNFGDDPITVTYEVRQGNTWSVVQESTLRSGGTLLAFGWDISNGTINGLRFSATGDFNWSVAQSPTVLPQVRAGWSEV